MRCITFLIAALAIFFSYSSFAHPWIPDYKKYELLISHKSYFKKIPSEISRIEYTIQKEIAEMDFAWQHEKSRAKKLRMKREINKLKKLSTYFFDYYPINEKNLNFEYGIAKKTSLGFSYSSADFTTHSNNKVITRKSLKPYLKYNLYNGKKFNLTLSSKLDNIYFHNTNKKNIDLGISIGYTRSKKSRKQIHYYDFNFSPRNFYQFNISHGIEFGNGYLAVTSISYFKTINSYRDINSDKVTGELFLSKKLFNNNGYCPSIFISYIAEHSKYSNMKISHAIQIGIYYK